MLRSATKLIQILALRDGIWAHCLYRVVVAIRARCRECRLIPQYRQLFVADGLPKTQRVQLPPLAEISITWKQ